MRREFRGGPETAPFFVEGAAIRFQMEGDHGIFQDAPSARASERCRRLRGMAPRSGFACGAQPRQFMDRDHSPALPMEFQDLSQVVREAGPSPGAFQRKVGRRREGFRRRNEENVQGPAALPVVAHQEIHREKVNIGTLLPVHFYGNEALVQGGCRRRIGKDFRCHHVAPMAGRVAYAHEQGLASLLRIAQDLRSPLLPPDRIVGMLAQVRGGSPVQVVPMEL